MSRLIELDLRYHLVFVEIIFIIIRFVIPVVFINKQDGTVDLPLYIHIYI